MNLILFQAVAELAHLQSDKERMRHLNEILRITTGDEFFIGVENGPIGKAKVVHHKPPNELAIEVAWSERIVPPLPIELWVGLPRPQTARKILFDAAAMGIRAVHFFAPEKGEASYRQSSLWSTDEWRRHLRQGAEQGFGTSIPEIIHHQSLEEVSSDAGTQPEDVLQVALDLYEAAGSLASILQARSRFSSSVLAIGSERGWSATEREVLRARGFQLAHLGPRVLRTESACVAGINVIASDAGWLDTAHRDPFDED